MKGCIVDAIRDLVVEHFGQEKWYDILDGAGLPVGKTFSVGENIPDETVLAILNSMSRHLNMTPEELADAFGEYWVTVYTRKVYKPYYRGITNAREFLLKMDEIHRRVTTNIPEARPPRFSYQWEGPNTLIMTYKSHRGLMGIFLGALKGVGKLFNTPLEIEVLDGNRVRITFPNFSGEVDKPGGFL